MNRDFQSLVTAILWPITTWTRTFCHRSPLDTWDKHWHVLHNHCKSLNVCKEGKASPHPCQGKSCIASLPGAFWLHSRPYLKMKTKMMVKNRNETKMKQKTRVLDGDQPVPNPQLNNLTGHRQTGNKYQVRRNEYHVRITFSSSFRQYLCFVSMFSNKSIPFLQKSFVTTLVILHILFFTLIGTKWRKS